MKQKDGTAKTMQTGTNGFTHMINGDGTPCAAATNPLAWMKSIGAKQDPSNKVAFIYMLARDPGNQ